MYWDPQQSQQAVYAAQTQQPYGAPDEKRSLWMGDLEPWMDENYLKQLWYSMGEVVQIKSIRDKISGMGAGYCFVDFSSTAAANKALTTINGSPISGTSRIFKLNWASGGSAAAGGGGASVGRTDMGNDFSVFVGDLGPEVTDYLLLTAFQGRYTSCRMAKVVMDPGTGVSKGYGFVRFGEESDKIRALSEMEGQQLGSRAIRVSEATPKPKAVGAFPPAAAGFSQPQQFYSSQPAFPPPQINNDPNNTTIFIGNIPPLINEEELKSYFYSYGEIVYCKIPPGKGCGFVQFVHRQSAEYAIQNMNGNFLGAVKVRVSWGRSQTGMGASNVFTHPQQVSDAQDQRPLITPMNTTQLPLVENPDSLGIKYNLNYVRDRASIELNTDLKQLSWRS